MRKENTGNPVTQRDGLLVKLSMNRQQRRKSNRKKSQNKTNNISKEQLAKSVEKVANKELENAYQRGLQRGVDEALALLLTLPLEVLMDHYWKKSYAEKIPEFTNFVLEYYERWQNGELDMDKLKQDLWEYGRVKLEVENQEENSTVGIPVLD